MFTAAKHEVKCLNCGKMFDINKEPYYKPRANRYAHINCTAVDPAEENRQKILTYLKDKFGSDKLNYPLIAKQIKDYEAKGLTLSGVYKTLVWWYDIRKNDFSKAQGGIGIVAHVYEQARTYWEDLYYVAEACSNAVITPDDKRETIRVDYSNGGPTRPAPPNRRILKFPEDEE